VNVSKSVQYENESTLNITKQHDSKYINGATNKYMLYTKLIHQTEAPRYMY